MLATSSPTQIRFIVDAHSGKCPTTFCLPISPIFGHDPGPSRSKVMDFTCGIGNHPWTPVFPLDGCENWWLAVDYKPFLTLINLFTTVLTVNYWYLITVLRWLSLVYNWWLTLTNYYKPVSPILIGIFAGHFLYWMVEICFRNLRITPGIDGSSRKEQQAKSDAAVPWMWAMAGPHGGSGTPWKANVSSMSYPMLDVVFIQSIRWWLGSSFGWSTKLKCYCWLVVLIQAQQCCYQRGDQQMSRCWWCDVTRKRCEW